MHTIKNNEIFTGTSTTLSMINENSGAPVLFIRFTVVGTVLPVEMAYSTTSTVQSSFPSVNRGEQMAKTVVERQIMIAVDDVLEEEGRNALLPPFITSQILQQISISISYTPIQCVTASDNPANPSPNFMVNMPEGCFGYVTNVCSTAAAGCAGGMVVSVPSKYMNITGELRTSNIVMANWSRQIKESVFSRVRRRLSSSSTSFGMFFNRATITLNN